MIVFRFFSPKVSLESEPCKGHQGISCSFEAVVMGKRSSNPMRGRLAPCLLVCLIRPLEGRGSRISPMAAFVPLPSTPSTPAHHKCQAPHHRRLGPRHQKLSDMQHHDPVDDDDVSQHEFMINDDENDQRGTALGKSEAGRNDADNKKNENTKRKTGYRPIEDWHDEYRSKNADEFKAITHLQREKARWGKTFESLGGDGI